MQKGRQTVSDLSALSARQCRCHVPWGNSAAYDVVAFAVHPLWPGSLGGLSSFSLVLLRSAYPELTSALSIWDQQPCATQSLCISHETESRKKKGRPKASLQEEGRVMASPSPWASVILRASSSAWQDPVDAVAQLGADALLHALLPLLALELLQELCGAVPAEGTARIAVEVRQPGQRVTTASFAAHHDGPPFTRGGPSCGGGPSGNRTLQGRFWRPTRAQHPAHENGARAAPESISVCDLVRVHDLPSI